MTWFRLDDGFALHAKVVTAGNAAVGLWVRAACWSAAQLTDGRIPVAVAKTLGTHKEAVALETAGLWRRHGDTWVLDLTCIEIERPQNPYGRIHGRILAGLLLDAGRIPDQCTYCGHAFDADLPPTVDHVVPLSRGGSNELDNLTWACLPCNQRKGTKLLEEWVR